MRSVKAQLRLGRFFEGIGILFIAIAFAAVSAGVVLQLRHQAGRRAPQPRSDNRAMSAPLVSKPAEPAPPASVTPVDTVPARPQPPADEPNAAKGSAETAVRGSAKPTSPASEGKVANKPAVRESPETGQGTVARTDTKRPPVEDQHRAEDTPEPGHRLKGKGSLCILALTEEAASQLRQKRETLGELAGQGLLFSVPSRTAVEVQASDNGLVSVRILEGSYQGRTGWVRADQVAGK